MENPSSAKVLEFDINRWLSMGKEDGDIVREAAPADSDVKRNENFLLSVSIVEFNMAVY